MRPARLYGAYVFDMNRTIYLGDEVLPGVRETLAFLRERGIPRAVPVEHRILTTP